MTIAPRAGVCCPGIVKSEIFDFYSRAINEIHRLGLLWFVKFLEEIVRPQIEIKLLGFAD